MIFYKVLEKKIREKKKHIEIDLTWSSANAYKKEFAGLDDFSATIS